MNFFDRSSAGTSGIGSGQVNFFDNSTAGSAVIDLFFGGVNFFDNSSAGSAILIASGFADSVLGGGGAAISFLDFSQGDTAQIRLSGLRNSLDISAHSAPGVTIGSLEGFGEFINVFLGANNLTVGSNNLSTTFSGVIQDGAPFGGGGTGGSLTKIGTGTFILTGANTYTGDTNVNRGVLQVDGSITSNTVVNRAGTLTGMGTINGNLTNNGRVSPGSAGSPGMLTVTGNYTQAQYAALMLQLAGANAGEFSVLNILGTANLSGQLKPLLLNGFLPTVGESFTFLQYGAVNGTLFMYNRNIDNLPEHWDVSYFPTFAVLTVAAGNVPVPDQGSTFVLLTLGLLGLVMCRRQCRRGFRTKRG
jgi:autotransporter-associated beta strand protein